MSSLQESETGSDFISGKDDVPLRNDLHKMGHIQGPTKIKFANIFASDIITDTVVKLIYKAMDTRFYWLCDLCRQNQFRVNWKQGNHNLANHPSKHHYKKYHISVQPTFVLNTTQKNLFKTPMTLKG